MWEVALLGALIAYTIHQERYFAAATLALCAAICTFLSTYPLDEGTGHLPAREAFLNHLASRDHDDDATEIECPMCYDAVYAPARLPCGHFLCHDCVRQGFGPKFSSHWCPTCRLPLFKARAPWNTLHVKIIACDRVLGFVRTVCKLIILVVQHQRVEHSAWPFFDLIFLVGGLVLDLWAVVQMYRSMDQGG